MKLKTLTKTARDWQHELKDHVRPDNGSGEAALLAWQILGGLVVIGAIYTVIAMSPEMVRYLKIKRM